MASLPRIRVCVPYPNHGAITPETSESLVLLKKCPDVFVEVVEIRGSSISVLRNIGINEGASQLKRQAPDHFDYYLSLDADIGFTVDNLKKLLSLDLDIVGAAYRYRNRADLIVAGLYEACEGDVRTENFLPAHSTGLKEVDWIGAGFTLIKRRVFATMEYPWYREMVIEYNERGEDYASWAGEDVGFCVNARRAGFTIFCDCDCKVRHLAGDTATERFVEKDGKLLLTVDDAARVAEEMLEEVKGIIGGFRRELKKKK